MEIHGLDRSDVHEDDVLELQGGMGGRRREEGGAQGKNKKGGRRRQRRGEVGEREIKKVNKEEGNTSEGSGNDGRVGLSCT